MRILFANRLSKKGFTASTTTAEGIGGIEIATQHIARGLSQRDHQVSVATNIEHPVMEDGIDWIPASTLKPLLGGSTKYDAIISSNDSMPFEWNGPTSNTRFMLWQHNPMPLIKAVRKKQLLPILKTKPHLVCVGTYLKDSFSPLYPFRSRQVIGLAVSDTFKQGAQATVKPRSIWLSQSQRGLKETLELWMSRISPEVPDAEMLVFGCQHREQEYDAEALKRAGIKFMPRTSQKELAEYLNDSRVMIYPGAKDETFCLAAAEAQCSGVPVVTKGIGSLSERVTHGVNGLVFRSDDDIVEGSLKILRDDEYWTRLRNGALELRTTLSWEQVALEWETHLSSVS